MESLNQIEKGNTQIGVNAAVILFLLEEKKGGAPVDSLFDIPCGEGQFLRAVKKFFPDLKVRGQDLYTTPHPEIQSAIIKADAKDFSHLHGEKFDVITSISGVMVFDDVSGLFQRCSAHLNPGGILVVTNDNILTLRDRFSFLLFGRLRRFKLLYSPTEGNWNVVLIQGLWKQFISNNFVIEKVEYTSLRLEDYLLMPFALIIYPLQVLYLLLSKGEMSLHDRFRLFSFKSLVARHYVIFGRKKIGR